MTAPLTHNDAVAIGDALGRYLHEDGIRFAGALEAAIRRQAGPRVRRADWATKPSPNEQRHAHLCGWVAAQLGLTAAAEARAARYLEEMAANPCGSATAEEAAVVGLDSVVNRRLHAADPLERLAMVGALLTAAAKEAASCSPAPPVPPST